MEFGQFSHLKNNQKPTSVPAGENYGNFFFDEVLWMETLLFVGDKTLRNCAARYRGLSSIGPFAFSSDRSQGRHTRPSDSKRGGQWGGPAFESLSQLEWIRNSNVKGIIVAQIWIAAESLFIYSVTWCRTDSIVTCFVFGWRTIVQVGNGNGGNHWVDTGSSILGGDYYHLAVASRDLAHFFNTRHACHDATVHRAQVL